MTTPIRAQALIDNYEVPEVAPMSPELVALLDLPSGLPEQMTIAEMADATGVSAHTLRYYERIGLLEVARDSGGRRVYDEESRARVAFVTRLRMSDMPIGDIQRYVRLVAQGDVSIPERLALMEAHRASIRARLQRLQAALGVIEYKITTYGGSAAP